MPSSSILGSSPKTGPWVGDARSCVLIWRACGTSWARSPACRGPVAGGGKSSKLNGANHAVSARSRLDHRVYAIHSALPFLDLAMAKLIVVVVLVALAMTKMPASFSHPNSNVVPQLLHLGEQLLHLDVKLWEGRLRASSKLWPQKNRSSGSRP